MDLYIINNISKTLNTLIMFKYQTTKQFLSNHQCKFLLKNVKPKLNFESAATGQSSTSDKTIRDSNICFIPIDMFPAIKEQLHTHLINMVKIKGYELNFDDELLQFTEYKTDGHYRWHEDSSKEMYSDRYCSLVMQLNDDYEGGELQLKEFDNDGNENIITLEKGEGNLFVFLSSITHRVTTITYGTRYSLVSWFKLKPIKDFKKTML